MLNQTICTRIKHFASQEITRRQVHIVLGRSKPVVLEAFIGTTNHCLPRESVDYLSLKNSHKAGVVFYYFNIRVYVITYTWNSLGFSLYIRFIGLRHQKELDATYASPPIII